MLGTIVNVLAIIIGGLFGFALKEGLPEKISNTVMHGLALCVIFIGISGLLNNPNVLLLTISIAIGAVIGELIDIDRLLKKLGDSIENRFKNKTSKLSEGFVTASLVFCVGAMAIVGSLESGLQGNHSILYTKAILDGIASIIFASTLGIGVVLSSISVFLYQGSITVASSFLKDLLNQGLINEMTAVGSLLIVGLGLNMLGITKIKVANMLPAVFIPVVYEIIRSFLH